MPARSLLAAEPFDPLALLREFSAQAAGVGAIASFTGVARSTSKAGAPVSGLFLDHHERLTLRSVEEIAGEALGRFDVPHLLAAHRIGWVAAGQPIVLVAAASPHRRAALQAVDYTMDRLKTDAMFWKWEDAGEDEGKWIEPTGQDYQERRRWDSE